MTNSPKPFTTGISREMFLARISSALGRRVPTAPDTPAPAVDERIVRVTKPDSDLSTTFAASAKASGMSVHQTLAANVSQAALDLLRTLGARRAAIAAGSSLGNLTKDLQRSEVEIVPTTAEQGFTPLYDVEVGITDVQAAIAETGSLVCSSGPGRARGVSLVPPIHIAFVKRSDILPDLIDLWNPDRPNAAAPFPSGLVLITGPSKTADIEGVLITGVHGPREVHIILIQDA